MKRPGQTNKSGMREQIIESSELILTTPCVAQSLNNVHTP